MKNKKTAATKKSPKQKLEVIIKEAEKLSNRYKVTNGKKFRLKNIDPADINEMVAEEKPLAKKALQQSIEALSKMQDMLYAQDKWAILLIIQAMDAAGKDGAIKHVLTGVNPQGCQVASFKAPSSEELDHDFLWRCSKHLPERGRIGIFNRSYYEEVLVVRVHEEILKGQKLPPQLISKKIWQQRFEDIRNYEQYLVRNGVMVVKFFLHVSKEEQKKRFIERIDDPDKNWKFSAGDVKERELWKKYMNAYEEMIQNTASDYAPWYVLPADNKWYTRIVLASAIAHNLHSLGLAYPEVSEQQKTELLEIRKQLVAENE